MASEAAKHDVNHYPVGLAVTNDANQDIKQIRVDATTGGVVVSGSISNGGYTTVASGRKSSSSVGTAVAIVAISTPCKKVSISVPTGNTSSQVAIGDSTALATPGSERGQILIVGASTDVYISDAQNIYVDVGTSGDAITFNVFN